MLTTLTVPPYRLVESSLLCDTDHAQVTEDQLLHNDGRLTTCLRVTESASTRVIALTPTGGLLLRWRWSHPAGYALLELPADVLTGGGDTPVEAARRALRTVGWDTPTWTPLVELDAVTGITAQTIHVYLAGGLHHVPAAGAADFAVVTVAWPQAVTMAASGAIRDTASAAAILTAAHTPGLDITRSTAGPPDHATPGPPARFLRPVTPPPEPGPGADD